MKLPALGAVIAVAFLVPWNASDRGAADVRVAVFGLFHARELAISSGDRSGIVLRTDSATCALRDREEARVSMVGDLLQVACAGRTLKTRALGVASLVDEAATVELRVPGRITRTYQGRIDISISGAELVPVVSMSLETAVASVVAAELADGTPQEALKAQAVAARLYFVAARGRHHGFDFCDTTHCQFLRQPPAPGHAAARAAHETAGVVLGFRGATLAALYSASCGGRTRSAADAGLPSPDAYPYFSVECAYCLRHADEWQRRLPLTDDTRALERERSEASRLTLGRQDGWATVPGNNFDVTREADAIVLHGRGLGHGIGLCQSGAAAMARSGASFAEILKHYYPGTTLTSLLQRPTGTR